MMVIRYWRRDMSQQYLSSNQARWLLLSWQFGRIILEGHGQVDS